MKQPKHIKGIGLCFAAICIMVLFAGCSDPEHRFAFNPDGRQIAFVNNDGIKIRDIESGKHETVYTSQEGFSIAALFWSEVSDSIYLLEVNSNDPCDGEEDTGKIEIYFRNLALDSKLTKVLYQNSVKCSEIEAENLYLMWLFVNYDEKTSTLMINNKIISIGDEESELARRLSSYTEKSFKEKEEYAGGFVLSPDKDYVYFFKDRGVNHDVPIELCIMSLMDMSVDTVYSTNRDFTTYNLVGNIHWNHDGSALYFREATGRKTQLLRYDLATKQKTIVFNENIIKFATDPSSDRILVFYERDGSKLASIINGNGAVEETFSTFIPDDPTEIYLMLSPNGQYAAALITNPIG
ncbi:MAG TPA: hypothetical protein PLN69_10990 [bacterium]|nr:hypothetical protein [bacterium]